MKSRIAFELNLGTVSQHSLGVNVIPLMLRICSDRARKPKSRVKRGFLIRLL
ncbi:MAG: hypothetical protein HN736_08655 [Anaerolineae bacterium]|nr:hypothetical protein [Anaerolineae bacterium]MBT3712732.1 hypothetical protein [Anaerolineae bacterium]MBT4309761.1 hypothetical protein [Anaerolineae bacterium]MBT4457982.1 hypothetical protein [Anaerolineae bacterium]MBT4841342.1 hypothetical protein [Anaerolineae bacterium]